MARTVREFNADWSVTIVVASSTTPSIGSLPEGVRLAVPADIGVSIDEELAAMLDGPRLLESLRGPVLTALSSGDEPAIFLAPSLRVVGPLDALESALVDAEVVLVPYLTSDDDVNSLSADNLAHGVIHPGVIAVRAGTQSSAVFEAWPTRELALRKALAPNERTAFEAWLDGLPVRFPAIAPLPNPRFLAGYWNLDDQDAQCDGSALVVEGRPVSLVDFEAFDPAQAHLFATKHPKPSLVAMPAIAELCAKHATELVVATEAISGHGDQYASLPDDTALDFVLRRLAGEAFAAGELVESVFTQGGMEAFYDWLNAPAEHGSYAGLTRYHEAIWNDTDHVRAAYPQLDGPDGVGYAGWLCVHGSAHFSLPTALLPPEPDHVKVRTPVFDSAPPWGVNVAGFFSSELGLGEAARLLIGALDAADVPALPVQGTLIPPCRQEAEFTFVSPDRAPFPINIICMNGDTIPVFARDAGKHFFERRYSIALWWWEVGTFPENWHEAFDYLDEIWVASDHIYKAIAAVSPIPVFKVPMPVIVPRILERERTALGMPEGTFNFLFIYDYHSTSARKNPVGLVTAFKQAFPPGSGASLVLKCINSERLPSKHEEVLVAAEDHPDIHVVDRYVSAAEKDAMVAACDCYVSLHRSEGFGLTPAEAMWLGKPVIATRYGGTLEFMTPDNSYLVDYAPAPVGEDAHPYPPDAIWAEPDLDQAAELMRHVFDHQDEARARGRRAYTEIRNTNSTVAAGAAMKNRLQVIYDRVQKDRSFDTYPTRPVPRWDQLELAKSPGLVPRLKRLVKIVLSRGERILRRRQLAIDSAAAAVERKQAASHAETLGGFRRARSELDDLRRQLATFEPRLERHLAEHRVLPYMAEGSAFQTWTETQAGTVIGFREATRSEEAPYRAFADAFRGSEDHVKAIQRPYVDLLMGSAPVLDVGCGRGELLNLLDERGIGAIGIDSDFGMVAHCKEAGHTNVLLDDANHYLESIEAESLGAIFSAQVIEHMPYQELVRFLELSVAKLRHGGLFVAETVNVHSLQSLKTFWVDPTHEHPLFPETMLELCRIAGFAGAYVFHPNGVGDVNVDRYDAPAYAVVARTSGG